MYSTSINLNLLKIYKMQYFFIMIDGNTRVLFDILSNRILSHLRLLSEFSLRLKKIFNLFKIDLYRPCIKLTKILFSNAKLVLDKFNLTY